MAWDEGIKGIVVAHLLFGVERLGARAPNIALRCGTPRRGALGGTAGGACHKQHGAHYSHILAPEAVADRPSRKRKRKINETNRTAERPQKRITPSMIRSRSISQRLDAIDCMAAILPQLA